MENQLYWKITQPDGTAFHDNKTKYEVGKTVAKQVCDNPELCTDMVLHASETIRDALSYARIPCRIHRVSGIPVVREADKLGFFSLTVEETIPESNYDDLLGFKYSEAVNPINPSKIEGVVDDAAWEILKKWASVRDSVWDSIWDSVMDSIWGPIRDSVRDSIWDSIRDSIVNFVMGSIRDSVMDSIWDSVRNSVMDSIWGPIRDSVRDSIWAYMGTLFPDIKHWKHVVHVKGEYPFQPAVDLWQRGIVPVYDGTKWGLSHWKAGECIIEWGK